MGVVLVEEVPVGAAAEADKAAAAGLKRREAQRQARLAEEGKLAAAAEARQRRRQAAEDAAAAAEAARTAAVDAAKAAEAAEVSLAEARKRVDEGDGDEEEVAEREREVKRAEEAAAAKAAAAGMAAARAAAAAREMEQDLDEWGLPKERPRAVVLALPSDTCPARRWCMYHRAGQLTELLAWLHPKGVREGPLRALLLKVRDKMAAEQAPGQQKDKGGDKDKEKAKEEQTEKEKGKDAKEGAGGSGEKGQPAAEAAPSEPLPPPVMLLPSGALAPRGRGPRQGSAAAAAGEQQQGGEDAMEVDEGTAEKEEEAAGPSDEAVELRGELLALFRGLPAEAFCGFWGSAARRERWAEFVGGAETPTQLSAAMTVLEAMLVDEVRGMEASMCLVPVALKHMPYEAEQHMACWCNLQSE